MADDRDQSPIAALAAQRVETSLEAHAAHAQELARLREVLLKATEQDLRLHRRTLEIIQAMRSEMERMRRKLKVLGTAR